MTLSSMVVSRDWAEVSVLECILGGLHIGVDVEPEPARARVKLAKSKIDALIVDCDLEGTTSFLRGLGTGLNAVPLVIVSGSNGHTNLQDTGAAFSFKKPISVEQAVRTLSAARNMILDGRLRYNRHTLDLEVSVAYGSRKRSRGPSHEPQPGRGWNPLASAAGVTRSGARQFSASRKQSSNEGAGRGCVDGQDGQRRNSLPGDEPGSKT